MMNYWRLITIYQGVAREGDRGRPPPPPTSVVSANLCNKTNATCIFRVYHDQKKLLRPGSAPDPAGGASSGSPDPLADEARLAAPPQRTPLPVSAFGLDFRPFGPQSAAPNSNFCLRLCNLLNSYLLIKRALEYLLSYCDGPALPLSLLADGAVVAVLYHL